ncbi:MAG: hypothetical protein H6511_07865 [Holophagales bacterium]|nr:hypothetical protein [Holophagales bacterium]
MKHAIVSIVSAAAVLTLAAPPSASAGTHQGEVVQVQERVQLANGAERQQITVRTREGEELRFHLGEPGACADCVALGDQVRVRTTRGASSDGAYQARRMEVDRTQQQHTFCSRTGELVPTQSRAYGASGGRGGSGQGAGDMDRVRDRDRIHAPAGSGTGAGSRGGGRGQGGPS